MDLRTTQACMACRCGFADYAAELLTTVLPDKPKYKDCYYYE
ncbi:MAG TPA: hypothetical protein VFG30_33690 [Polyangiales bacterium]|nr:hypothetical protein [Polyangiales bacterium]